MKLLNCETTTHKAKNLYGWPVVSSRTLFEVQHSDVGDVMADYNGFGRDRYTFSQSDVGRRITVYSYEKFSSWTFS